MYGSSYWNRDSYRLASPFAEFIRYLKPPFRVIIVFVPVNRQCNGISEYRSHYSTAAARKEKKTFTDSFSFCLICALFYWVCELFFLQHTFVVVVSFIFQVERAKKSRDTELREAFYCIVIKSSWWYRLPFLSLFLSLVFVCECTSYGVYTVFIRITLASCMRSIVYTN